ncbi:Bifunctional helicase and thymine dioxygenase JBP2, partial [Dissostichus eleginoides]
MQGYLCSSASQCPGKGPPQLNICTSSRLITHNTPAQPLPSLSPPQSSLETSTKKRRADGPCCIAAQTSSTEEGFLEEIAKMKALFGVGMFVFFSIER